MCVFLDGVGECDKEVEEVQLSLGAVALHLPIPVLPRSVTSRVFVFVCLLKVFLQNGDKEVEV